MNYLLIWSLALWLLPADGISVEGKFLKRGDLPAEFTFPVLDLDFAVLRIQVTNEGQEAWLLDPEQIEVQDPKGRSMEKAASTEITPKIMKSGAYRRGNRDVHGQVGTGPYIPGVYVPRRPGEIYIPGGPKTVAAGEAQEIRETLEAHQLQKATLEPGQTVEALLYFKSGKPAHELSGSTIVLSDGIKVKVN
ncbi:MAG: hypothetical protein ACRD1R_14000 [Acidobacteriota bacterium]